MIRQPGDAGTARGAGGRRKCQCASMPAFRTGSRATGAGSSTRGSNVMRQFPVTDTLHVPARSAAELMYAPPWPAFERLPCSAAARSAVTMFRVRFTKSGRSSRGYRRSSSSMKRLSPRSFDVSGAPINRRVAFSKQLPILTSAGISGYAWFAGRSDDRGSQSAANLLRIPDQPHVR